jgi:predicted acylesterase/phospholipase RssA
MTQPSADQITAVLNSSVQAPLDGLFQIALVLGGTVSTGAYTAGFLDKLIEALDAWYGAKAQGLDVPQHEVRLRVATGASGGGVSAALLARMLAYGITPVRPNSSAAEGEAHLLYNTWVNRLDIESMVDPADLLPNETPKSVLNGGGIKEAARAAATGPTAPQPLPHHWPQRPYVDNPFRVIVTLGNLTGVPYTVPFEAGKELTARAHADYARFACDISGMGAPPLTAYKRPDEFFEAAGTSWETLATYAAAGGAFPLVLPPYPLTRPRVHYEYRATVVPGDQGSARALPLCPQWASPPEADYSFLSVDGGMFNNEPLELARTYLAGLTGRNPRDGDKSDRAVILVDPLSGPLTLGDMQAGDVFDQGLATLDGFLQQSRFATSDLLLMADPSVFSRFLVSPHRGDVTGDRALASGGLAGFIGFFARDFRHHDYMLGRANCLKFLQEEFVLHAGNPLFQHGRWTEAQKEKYRPKAGEGVLPIIPLVGAAAEPDEPVDWPTGALTAATISKTLKPRLNEVVQRTADGALNFPLSDLLIALVKGFGTKALLSKLEAKAAKDLKDWKLLPDRAPLAGD